MSDPAQKNDPLAPLLRTAQQARQRGDTAGARALLRALSTRYPHDQRVWMLLAGVAEHRAEQRHALEHVLAIDPGNQPALRALAAFPAAPPAPAVVAPPASVPSLPETQPQAADDDELADEAAQPAGTRWTLITVLVGAVLVLLVAAWLIWRPQTPPGSGTPANATSIAAEPTGTPLAATLVAEPTLLPATAIPGQPTAIVPTGVPPLAIGQIAQADSWNMILLPSDAVILSGSIGQLQPQGRFLLALVSVSNDTDTARAFPQSMLTLVDANGRSYTADPAASSAYLREYGEGQAGVQSLAEAVAAGGGMVSIPLIFDVPEGNQQFQFLVNGSTPAWPLEG